MNSRERLEIYLLCIFEPSKFWDKSIDINQHLPWMSSKFTKTVAKPWIFCSCPQLTVAIPDLYRRKIHGKSRGCTGPKPWIIFSRPQFSHQYFDQTFLPDLCRASTVVVPYLYRSYTGPVPELSVDILPYGTGPVQVRDRSGTTTGNPGPVPDLSSGNDVLTALHKASEIFL